MKFSNSNDMDLFTTLLKQVSLLVLLFAAMAFSGCKSNVPVGGADFDSSYGHVLESNEQLLFSARTELVSGTYMEEEEELFPSYDGVLLLTSERMLFVRWNEQQRLYEPAVWTSYPYIAQLKKHNNTLLQYVAIIATDGSKFTYMLGKDNVDRAYAILLERIRKNHHAPGPSGPTI